MQNSDSRETRRGIQLLELIISMTTASLLLAGLATSVFLASEGRERAVKLNSTVSRTQSGLDRLRQDLAEAKSFLARSSDGATFMVDDRDGDGQEETLQYVWSETGSPLIYIENSGSGIQITESLDQFQLAWRARTAQAVPVSSTFDPLDQYLLQSHTLAVDEDVTGLSISIPDTYVLGDLLVAVFSIDENNELDPIVAPAGWNLVVQQTNNVSLAVLYSYAAPEATVTINWSEWADVIATVVHFRTATGTGALDDYAQRTGISTQPRAPEAEASNPNSLIVRAIATEQAWVSEEAANLPGHIPVVFRAWNGSDPTIGVVYRSNTSAGSIPEARYELEEETSYCSATLVFTP